MLALVRISSSTFPKLETKPKVCPRFAQGLLKACLRFAQTLAWGLPKPKPEVCLNPSLRFAWTQAKNAAQGLALGFAQGLPKP